MCHEHYSIGTTPNNSLLTEDLNFATVPDRIDSARNLLKLPAFKIKFCFSINVQVERFIFNG